MPDIDADAFGQWFFDTRGYYPDPEDHRGLFEVWRAAWRIANETNRQQSAIPTNGYFITDTPVGIGEKISIKMDGQKRIADVVKSEIMEDRTVKLYFRWVD